MKKITKRIMALMLSLVMILGCIPSFINEASAVTPIVKRIDELLAMADDFPLIKYNAWVNEKGYLVYRDSNTLVFSHPTQFAKSYGVVINNSASSFDGNGQFYYYEDSKIKIYLEVEDNKLTSIEVESSTDVPDFKGIYKPAKRIFDILDTAEEGFPTSNSLNAPDNAWKSTEGHTSYVYSNSICFNTTTLETFDTSFIVKKEGNNYIEGENGITFVMTDEKLTSINYDGETYAPVPKTIADILATVPEGFPTTSGNGWKSDNSVSAYLNNTGLAFYNNNSMATYNNGKATILTKNADGNYEHTDKQLTFVMTNGILTSIICGKDGFTGTYEPAVKTITVNYEQPKTLEELMALSSNTNAITVNANATSISNFTKRIIPAPLYLMANENPDFLGYFVCLTALDFSTEPELAAVDSVYLRDIDLEKPTKTFTQLLPIASTIDSAVVKDGKTILVIEKYDFSKKLNVTASLNANMKVVDAINSISDNITDVGVVRNYNITEEPYGSNLADDATLEAGKKYYLHGEIKNLEASISYNQVSINDEILPHYTKANPEKPYNVSNTMYDDDASLCGFLINYEFTIASNSSGGSKTYKAKDDKDTAEKISGSGKKGSKRIVTPEEGRKVESVIVTDKDGNRYEVTNEGDGTYSFIQPGKDVTVEVKYKNRLIELTIGSLDASVDDVHHSLDVVPKVVNDRTMLPIRFVAENLGAKVDWDEKDPDTVVITRGDTRIEITLGSDIAKVNGQEYKLDSVAFAENDRTYLPVRFVSEKLNAIVEWNEAHPMDVKIYERQ